jgi:internalin A
MLLRTIFFICAFAYLPTAVASPLTMDWWNGVSDNWKTVFREKAKFSSDRPSAAQLNKIYAIKSLDCANKNLSTLAPVSVLKNLEVIWCDQNAGISDLSPLQNLSKLKELDCSGTRVSDLSPLSNLTQLTKIIMYDTGVTDLNPLKNLNKLTGLDISGTRVTNISPIAGLHSLEALYFARTKVNDISSINTLINLGEITFSNSEVKDISILKYMKQLREAVFASTGVSQLGALKDIQTLSIVYCTDTKVTADEANVLQNSLPDCVILY